jgi:putative transposase
VLEASCGDVEVRTLVSLTPSESTASAASKLKGRLSKWLREQLHLEAPAKLLGKGYFACTSGKSTRSAVDQYLDGQSDHHGYSDRAWPPVFACEFPVTRDKEDLLQAKHAATILHFHIVLSTWRRQGVFSSSAGEALAECWRGQEVQQQFVLRKISVVPDHVHLAVRAHPSTSPASLIASLMNTAQEMMWNRFEENVIRGAVERLWQPGAYLGTFGNLASPQIQQYIRNCDEASP